MDKPVVLLYEPIHPQAVERLVRKAEVRYAASLNEDDLIRVVRDVDAIILRANGKVSRRPLEYAPRLKVIARHGVGIEAIDRQAAAARGIWVVNTPDASTQAVAEACLGMMIVLAKRMFAADRALRGGDWEARHRLTGVELYGKTVGLVGFGRIGQRVGSLCHAALGMPILYTDIQQYSEIETALGARRVSIDELLAASDFVSLHVPLLPTTRGLVNREALHRMKPSAYLINTSRGAVVDQAALVCALREGWIAGAGLDVFDPEPLPVDSPLFKLENVVLTPHMASHTNEALFRMALVVEDVLRVLDGQPPQHPITA